MGRTAAYLLLLHGLILAAPAAAGGSGPQPIELGHVEELRDILLVDGAPVIRGAYGDYGVVSLPEGKLALAPLPEIGKQPVPGDIIPHAVVSRGKRNVRAAWLAGPTPRYAHGVLGDAIEASVLKAEVSSGDILSFALPDHSVFEDLTPRLADMDGDGTDEIIVVRSYVGAGAAVALFGLRGGKLALLAESPAIGLPNRWLNPVGAGDFDGDGKKEIAIVQTPHIGGILIFYRWQRDKLVAFERRAGYSTHAMGSTVLGMAAVLDIDGDGADEILLPDQARTELFGLSYRGGEFHTVWNTPNPERIVTSVVTVDVDGNGALDVLYGLDDGTVRILPR